MFTIIIGAILGYLVCKFLWPDPDNRTFTVYFIQNEPKESMTIPGRLSTGGPLWNNKSFDKPSNR